MTRQARRARARALSRVEFLRQRIYDLQVLHNDSLTVAERNLARESHILLDKLAMSLEVPGA